MLSLKDSKGPEYIPKILPGGQGDLEQSRLGSFYLSPSFKSLCPKADNPLYLTLFVYEHPENKLLFPLGGSMLYDKRRDTISSFGLLYPSDLRGLGS